jgi:hypothetical protein
MQTSRRICKYDFTIAAGSGTTTVNLNPDSLGHARALTVEVSLTTIGTDAIDSLDFRLQEAADGQFQDRLRLTAIAGNTSASSSAPRVYRGVILADATIQASEKVYEVSGSSGTAITAGTTVNGPFVGMRRTSAGRQPSWRMQFVVTDADADASFIGTVTIWATSEI